MNRVWILGLMAAACQAPAPEPASDVPDATKDSVVATTTPDPRVASAQERLQSGGDRDSAPAAFAIPAEYAALDGFTEAQVRQRLGEPRAERRGGNRAVWVYPVAPEDPTGLYLYFDGGRVDSIRLDEFNGFEGNSALDWLR